MMNRLYKFVLMALGSVLLLASGYFATSKIMDRTSQNSDQTILITPTDSTAQNVMQTPSPVPPDPVARDYTCPEIVLQALTMTDEVCGGTGRNQACYGHMLVDAQPHPNIENFTFRRAGDTANLTDFQTLRLSAMDSSGLWGITLMQLQASLLNTLNQQDITLLLFGQVEIDNNTEATTLVPISVTGAQKINIRRTPSANATIVTTLALGQSLIATGRLADTSWLRVSLPDNGRTGWVNASLVTSTGNLGTLAVVEASSVYYAPMQAFYFQSGVYDAPCPEAPDSGLLVQTPEGLAEVTLLINEVDIQLAATAFLQAQPGNEMMINVVEGEARVSANGVTQYVTAGTQVSVPMGADLQPSGPPAPPHPYDMLVLQSLPTSVLNRPVTVHAPLSAEEMVAFQESAAASAASSSGPSTSASSSDPAMSVPSSDPAVPAAAPAATTAPAAPAATVEPEDEGDGTGWQESPGLGGAVPPGHGGDTPPGQDDTEPPKDGDKDKEQE